MHLAIRSVSKTYANGVRALHDITLDIPLGMYGLLGPNGAGKSTLMRTIATLQEPDTGSITLTRPRHWHRRPPREGPCPPHPRLPPAGVRRLPVGERRAAARSLRRPRRVHRPQRAARVVEALLRQTNLWDVRKERLGGYSGGCASASASPSRSSVTRRSSSSTSRPRDSTRPSVCAFLNLLSEIGENSVVILSTHIVDDVAELCRRMAIIDRGEILLEAEPLAAIDALRGRVWKRVVAKQSCLT
jgi:ABC-type multidrug transport system ATPase subunit